MKTIPWNAADHIRTEEEAAAYLEAWFELNEGGPDAEPFRNAASVLFAAGYAAAREQAAKVVERVKHHEYRGPLWGMGYDDARSDAAAAIFAMTPKKDPAP